jgi:hypothetical protein
MKRVYGALLMVVAGCSGQGSTPEMKDVEITETATELNIVGRDAAKVEMGRLNLKLGRFTMTVDDRGEVDGRQMTVEVS